MALRMPSNALATRFGGALDRWARSIFSALLGWVLFSVALGFCLGATIAAASSQDIAAFIAKNQLSLSERQRALWLTLGGGALLPTAYAATWLVLRRVRPEITLKWLARRANRYGFVLLCLPAALVLGVPNIEANAPVLVLLLALLVALSLTLLAYRVGAHVKAPATRVSWLRRLLPVIALTLLGGSYIAVMSHLSIVIHRAFNTHFDLAVYDNIFWQSLHGNPLGCSFCIGQSHTSDHFDPILVLLSPLYWFSQRAETLLVLQSVWLSSGVIPLYLMSWRKLQSRWLSAALSAAYLLYPALHGINLFAFHSLALAGPLLLWCVYLLDTASGWYALTLALLLFTREDMSLVALFLGAYAVFCGRYRTGLITLVAAFGYLLLVKNFAMADTGLLMSGGDHSTSFAYYYTDMIPDPEQGAWGLFSTVVTNPAYTLGILFEERKLVYYLSLLAPLLLLPLLGGRKLVLMAYGAMFLGLSTRPAVASLHFQYSTVVMPFLFAAVPDAIARIRDGACQRLFQLSPHNIARALVSGILVSSIVCSIKFGGFGTNTAFKAGFTRPRWGLSAGQIQLQKAVRELIKQIPEGASVAVTRNLSAHVSNRARAIEWYSVVRSLLPETHNNVPSVDPSRADYLLIDHKANNQGGPEALKRLLRAKSFRRIASHGSIRLYRRRDYRPQG